MNTFFKTEDVLKALQQAAWVAEHGTREEKSGRFLPPDDWEGRYLTANGWVCPADEKRKREAAAAKAAKAA